MNINDIIIILSDIKYELKYAISNISLDKYTDSIYNLLTINDLLEELENKLSKENF